MAETVKCSIVGQKSRGGNAYAASAAYMGYGNGSTHYEYVLSFITGNFVGKSNSITFNIKMSNSSQGATRTYRWALLNSDSSVVGRDTSVNLYFDKHTEVDDPNQLAQGTVTWTDMNKDTNKVLTIETDALKANTNYFLVLWPYSTSPTSFVTVSNTQYHGGIVVEYEATFTVIVDHKLQNEDGSLTQFDQATYTIDAGTLYTPELISPPSTNTIDGATFKAWATDWSLIAEGVVGVDYVTVNEDLFVSVYYPLVEETGSYIHFKVNGQLIECEVLRITDGDPVLQELFYKDNGQIIEI